MTRRNLKGATVVLTGASSGIGRSAAYEFARRGANLVLAARRLEVLREVADECAELGGRALGGERLAAARNRLADEIQ